MMRTLLVEDGLTEEAVVTKLRAKACIHLFLHRSLQEDCSGIESSINTFLEAQVAYHTKCKVHLTMLQPEI